MLYENPQPLVDEVAVRAIRCLTIQAIRKGWFRRDQFEDLVQEAVVHLLQKAHGFDPAKASWSTFCSMVVRNFFTRLKSKRPPRPESLDETSQDAGQVEECQSLARQFTRYRSECERIEFEEDISSVLDSLPEELRQVCEQFLDEPSVAHAAEQLGVSRQTVYRRRESVKQWFVSESISEYR